MTADQLIETAAKTKTKTVKVARASGGRFQSGQSRAWSASGEVD